jgi:hypothetical protein
MGPMLDLVFIAGSLIAFGLLGLFLALCREL